MMFNPAQPSIAVALVLNSKGQLLLAWNLAWGSFTLPMTKLHLEQPAETPEQAGLRAAAEALGVPVRLVAGRQAKFARGLLRSPRDGEIKDYQYHVVAVEPHPDFAHQVSHEPLVWAEVATLRNGDYQPISKSVETLLQECAEWGWI